MLRLFLPIFVLLTFSKTFAYFDYSFSTQARTHAAALSGQGTIGYNYKIWGHPDSSIFYGYIRPFSVMALSPSSYENRTGVEFFPISFLGIEIKKGHGFRFVDTKGHDCANYQCQGPMNFTDVSLQIFLGYQDYFSSIRWTRSFFDATPDKSKPKLELGSSVLVSPQGDTADYYSLSIGQKNFFSDFTIGFYFQDNIFNSFGNRQQAGYFFTQTNLKKWEFPLTSVTAGVGAFQSSLSSENLSLFLAINYTPQKALGFGK